MLAVFFVAGGSPPPDLNEPHYLARLKHFWNPEWCQGDQFLESPDAHLTVVLLAGWTTKWLSLPVVAWGLRLLAWALLAWAWQRLSWRVVPAPWCSVLTAALWVTGMQQLHLGGEWVIGGVEAKCFAYALVLMALHSYLQGKWNLVWVQLGLASAMHALVGGWAVVVLFAIWLAYHRSEPRFSSMAPALIAGGLLALPGVLPPILMNSGTEPQVVAQANQIYVFDRLPHHLALLSMKPAWLADRAARHAVQLAMLAVVSLVVVMRTSQRDDHPSPVDRDCLLRLIRFAWGAALLMVVGFAIEWILAESPQTAAKLQRYYWYRLTDVAAPLAVALAVAAVLASALRSSHLWATGLLLVLLGASGWHLAERLQCDGQRATPPADRRVLDEADWRDACKWASEETPPGSVFLVPQYSQTFRWWAGRAQVVTWKDIPQDARGLVEWRRRINDVYYWSASPGAQPEKVKSLPQLGAQRLRRLGEEYGARFVLTSHLRPVSLRAAYRNPTYVIYDLLDPEGDPASAHEQRSTPRTIGEAARAQ